LDLPTGLAASSREIDDIGDCEIEPRDDAARKIRECHVDSGIDDGEDDVFRAGGLSPSFGR